MLVLALQFSKGIAGAGSCECTLTRHAVAAERWTARAVRLRVRPSGRLPQNGRED